MSSLFSQITQGLENVEEEFLGPDYNYVRFIKSPEEMGMTGDGNLNVLVKDIQGLVAYVQLLITGRGNANKTGQPLGNKFFLKTAGQCKNVRTGQIVDRHMYINNQPTGNIPLLSDATGANFSTFEGLIPGVIGNLDAVNPLFLFTAFTEGQEPDCVNVTLPTIDKNGNGGQGNGNVPIAELQHMINTKEVPPTVLNDVPKETFVNMRTKYEELRDLMVAQDKLDRTLQEKRDPMEYILYASMASLVAYAGWRYFIKDNIRRNK
jgi:hypothetical protein